MSCWKRKFYINKSSANCGLSYGLHKMNLWRIMSRKAVREFSAEFLGTFVLILFGNASVAQSQVTNESKGDFFAINWGWALGVMMGILISQKISGAHLNPAVTGALAIFGRFSWRKIWFYWLAQYLGAFLAAACVYGAYYEGIVARSGGSFRMSETNPGLAVIFSTYPSSYLSAAGGLGDQILGTALLLICICAITDPENRIPDYFVAFLVGLVILAIGICFGANCGYALNPARDLAPRLVSLIAGWGPEVFSFRHYNWFWILVVGPHIGAVLGILIYVILIEMPRTQNSEDRQESGSSHCELVAKPVRITEEVKIHMSPTVDDKCIVRERMV